MREVVAVRELLSPLGPLRVAATSQGLARIALPREGGRGFRGWLERYLAGARTVESVPVLDKAARELEEYFSGALHCFDLPLDLRGTDFQRAVWAEILRIPYGEVRSYGEIARGLGRAGASRAVGGAVGTNPVPIVVPCHRVIATGGRIGGYGGGLEAKRKLLALERARVIAG